MLPSITNKINKSVALYKITRTVFVAKKVKWMIQTLFSRQWTCKLQALLINCDFTMLLLVVGSACMSLKPIKTLIFHINFDFDFVLIAYSIDVIVQCNPAEWKEITAWDRRRQVGFWLLSISPQEWYTEVLICYWAHKLTKSCEFGSRFSVSVKVFQSVKLITLVKDGN